MTCRFDHLTPGLLLSIGSRERQTLKVIGEAQHQRFLNASFIAVSHAVFVGHIQVQDSLRWATAPPGVRATPGGARAALLRVAWRLARLQTSLPRKMRTLRPARTPAPDAKRPLRAMALYAALALDPFAQLAGVTPASRASPDTDVTGLWHASTNRRLPSGTMQRRPPSSICVTLRRRKIKIV